MIDNVVYERSVSKCVKVEYLQQLKMKNIPLSSVRSPPPFKNPGYATEMTSRRLCICVSCHFVCILLGSLCEHCKNVW